MIKRGNDWERWRDFFERELRLYNPDWTEDDELLSALDDIMEENQ